MTAMEPTDAASVRGMPGSDSLSVEVGDVVFTASRLTLMRGGQLVTSVRRDAIDSVDISNASASEHTGWTILFGGGAIIGALFSAASEWGKAHVSVGSLIGSLVALLFGVFVLRSAAATTTLVRVSCADGQVMLRIGRQLADEEVATLKRRLIDELGYPVTTPVAVPRGF
jgi:hypothetical protein